MKKNRKIYFLNIIIFIIAFLEFLFIATVGNQYTLHTNIFLPREDAPKVAVKIEKEGIVEFQGARMENGELVLDFRSIERGETKVYAGYQFSDEGGMISIHEHSFKVSATGVIMDRTIGELNFNGYQAVIIAITPIMLVLSIFLMASNIWLIRHEGRRPINMLGIAFATTNYHVFRGYILAERNEVHAKGIAAKTKAYFYPNAFLREFIGLLVEEKWRHIGLVLLIMLSLLQLSYWV
ncbi:MAG: hypothetical protein K6G85_05770 [Eubacterium sp.]|nr:hypothetical protein [Eubacterium sp.]